MAHVTIHCLLHPYFYESLMYALIPFNESLVPLIFYLRNVNFSQCEFNLVYENRLFCVLEAGLQEPKFLPVSQKLIWFSNMQNAEFH